MALLSAGEDFELADLLEDARRCRPGGGEVDELLDLGSSRGECLLGLGSLTGNGSLRAGELGLRGLDQMRDDLGSVEVSEHGRRKRFSKSRFHHGARVVATSAVAAARITSVARLLCLFDDHRAAADAAANEGREGVDPPGGTRSTLAGVGRGSHGDVPLPGLFVDGLHPRPGLFAYDAELRQRDLDHRRLGRSHDALPR
ncbi:MAG: hypothetical protein PVI24_11155 [Myxococcales bacterium]